MPDSVDRGEDGLHHPNPVPVTPTEQKIIVVPNSPEGAAELDVYFDHGWKCKQMNTTNAVYLPNRRNEDSKITVLLERPRRD